MRKCCTVRIYIYMPTRQRRNSLSAWHLSIRACQHHHYRFAGTYIQTHTHTQPKIAVYLVPKRKKRKHDATNQCNWLATHFSPQLRILTAAPKHSHIHIRASNFCNFHHYSCVAIIIGSRSRNSCRNMHQLTLTHKHASAATVISSWICYPFLNSVRYMCTTQWYNCAAVPEYNGSTVRMRFASPFLCDWFSVLASNVCWSMVNGRHIMRARSHSFYICNTDTHTHTRISIYIQMREVQYNTQLVC